MTRKETVTIAGKNYDIVPLPPRKADVWRAKTQQKVKDILNSLGGGEGKDLDDIKLTIPVMVQLACQAPAEVRELFFDYAPNVAKDKEFILDNGDDDEIIDGFAIAVRFAFQSTGKLASLIQLGFNPKVTTTNSPEVSASDGTNGTS